jgi:hypothetical protein
VAKPHLLQVSALLLFVSCLAHGQADVPDSIAWFHANQELRVTNLPSLTAASTDPSAVVATALETVLHDKAVCCGKDSALEDVVLSEPLSLKELGARSQGRHLLSGGRPVVVSAQYVAPDSVNPGLIIGALLEQHALLIQWKSHLYVLYGAIFNETRFYSGARHYAILKLLLVDPRFSDARREAVLNRESGDWAQVQGLLILSVAR